MEILNGLKPGLDGENVLTSKEYMKLIGYLVAKDILNVISTKDGILVFKIQDTYFRVTKQKEEANTGE